MLFLSKVFTGGKNAQAWAQQEQHIFTALLETGFEHGDLAGGVFLMSSSLPNIVRG